MVPELRQEAILASVRSRDISYIKDLAEELNISLSTIRRDIAALEEAGTVISMRGGAVKPVIAEEPAPAAVTEEAPVVKKRLIRSAIYAIIVGGALYLLYVTVLQTQLPTGALWKLFKT